MTEQEITFLRLSLEQREELQELSIKYSPTINTLMKRLSEIASGGTFKWSTPFGYLYIKIE